MKANLVKALLMCILAPIWLSCAGSKRSLNYRGSSQAALNAQTAGENSPVIRDGDATASTEVKGPPFIEAKNSEALNAEFRANILLASKISDAQLVIFGKDGRSWLYNPSESSAPTMLGASISKPNGSSLFTLPEGKFWLIGDHAVSRRKLTDAAPGVIPVENFDTSSIQGDWSKLKVLFVSNDQIILHLDTMIAILQIKDGKPILSQFSSKIPVDLEGDIRAAGETVDGGYWFAHNDTFAILSFKASKLAWTKLKIKLTAYEDYSVFAMRLDLAKKELAGDALLVQADKIWSISGAAIQ